MRASLEAPSGVRRRRRWLRGVVWVGLWGMCAVALRDAACEEAAESCQEVARRAGSSTERVCREAYFERRDPDDGLALARVLVARGELRGAAAISQGLLLTPARPDALVLLAKIAIAEARPEEAIRSLELAVEQHLRVERRREAAEGLLELGRLLGEEGQVGAARTAVERALELARQLGDGGLRARCAAALETATADGAWKGGGGGAMSPELVEPAGAQQ